MEENQMRQSTHTMDSVMEPLIFAFIVISMSRFMSSRTAGAPLCDLPDLCTRCWAGGGRRSGGGRCKGRCSGCGGRCVRASACDTRGRAVAVDEEAVDEDDETDGDTGGAALLPSFGSFMGGCSCRWLSGRRGCHGRCHETRFGVAMTRGRHKDLPIRLWGLLQRPAEVRQTSRDTSEYSSQASDGDDGHQGPHSTFLSSPDPASHVGQACSARGASLSFSRLPAYLGRHHLQRPLACMSLSKHVACERRSTWTTAARDALVAWRPGT